MVTSLEFAALRAQTDVFESVAAAVGRRQSHGAGAHGADEAAAVSEDFLDTLGVAPLLGRAVQRGDAARRSINISYEVWQRYFQGDPGIIGRTDRREQPVDDRRGVLPHGFKAYLGSGVTLPPQLDLLYWRSAGYDDDPFRGNVVIARLRRGVAIATARAAVDTIAGISSRSIRAAIAPGRSGCRSRRSKTKWSATRSRRSLRRPAPWRWCCSSPART